MVIIMGEGQQRKKDTLTFADDGNDAFSGSLMAFADRIWMPSIGVWRQRRQDKSGLRRESIGGVQVYPQGLLLPFFNGVLVVLSQR